jgi:hypothetical protein
MFKSVNNRMLYTRSVDKTEQDVRVNTCTLGYSDFHNLMGFTSKRCQIIFFKMFVKKVFQLVKPFLANLHSTISKKYSYMYSMTPKFF